MRIPWPVLVFALPALALIVCMPACGGSSAGMAGAPVDAGTDHSVRLADAGADRAVHDAGSERHLVDATTECEGGAHWGPCFVTDAAELACEASTDCTWQPNGDTCCGVPTVGVNKSAPFVGCPGLPCPPPKISQPECSLYFTQDCQAVDAAADIVLKCVSHRCMTSAASN